MATATARSARSTRSTRPVNRIARITKPNLLELQAAVLHAMAKVADKECTGSRDELTVGKSYSVKLKVVAEITAEDGQQYNYEQAYDASLSVGADTQRMGPAPNSVSLFSLIAPHLDAEQHAIISELIEAGYAKHGPKLGADDELGACEGWFDRMRQERPTTVRGAVTCKYTATQKQRFVATRTRRA